MSKSLIKGNYVNIGKDDKRVIDSNQAVVDRLQLLSKILGTPELSQEELEEGFSEGIGAEDVSALFAEQEEEIAQPEVDIEQLIQEANEQAQGIINNAKKQAQEIIANANAEAENIKASAYDDGLASGNEAGYSEGLARAKELEDEAQRVIAQVNEDYENMLSQLEPRFIEVLCDIYSRLINVDLSGRSSVVQFLLKDAIRNIEGGRNFLVHVSSGDYEYVKENKEDLMVGLASTSTVEIVDDISLGEGECFVEAESGIFDCSLGVQLENLRKELVLLSYQAQ